MGVIKCEGIEYIIGTLEMAKKLTLTDFIRYTTYGLTRR